MHDATIVASCILLLAATAEASYGSRRHRPRDRRAADRVRALRAERQARDLALEDRARAPRRTVRQGWSQFPARPARLRRPGRSRAGHRLPGGAWLPRQPDLPRPGHVSGAAVAGLDSTAGLR